MYATRVKGRLRPFGFCGSARAAKARLSICGSVAKTGAKADSGPGAARLCRGTAAEGERAMAEQEMKAASETYSGFLSLLKVGSIITAIVTVFVVLIIS